MPQTQRSISQTCVENIKARSQAIAEGVNSSVVTGLVIQGGGMRGVYSMGALLALEECGLGRAFDHVVASSAGALNGAYFLAGQARLGLAAYLEEVSSRRFINFLRLRKIVDIDFLVDDVIKKLKPLNLGNVRSSLSTLHIILTDYLTAKPAVVTNKDREVDLAEALRATAAWPGFYNRRVLVNGREYIDGAVSDLLPLFRAIEMGCTDILVVLSFQPNFRRRRPNGFLRILGGVLFQGYPSATRKAILSEDRLFNRTMAFLEQSQQASVGVRISVVYATDPSRMVSRVTRNRERLLACALMARNDIRRLMGFQPLKDSAFAQRMQSRGEL